MRVLIAGSSGAIAEAIHRQFSAEGDEVFTISRSGVVAPNHCLADLSDPESVEIVREFAESIEPDLVLCCSGILHNKRNMPEKSLKQFSQDWLMTSMQANVMPHVHLAQAIESLVKRSKPIQWVSLSAMVGSIEDNSLGGWYSYRMSKAALNMFVKNLSIEWGRKAPGSIVAALHPGTTESPLSEPFQAGIAEGKLYSRAETAERLIRVMRELNPEQHGKLLHWDGSILPF